LLHDIGHGPFSHSYEDFVHRDLPQFLRKHPDVQSIYWDAAWPDLPKDWTHEMASLMMIDASLAHLGLAIDMQHLDEPLKQIGNGIDARSMRATRNSPLSTPEEDDSLILTSRDWIFVKECIWGKPIPEIESVRGPGFHGRTQEHQDWLYDIVSNRHSGLDMDKVDYFARDRRRALRDSGEINKVMVEEAIVAWAECSDPTQCHRCQEKKSFKPKKHLMICYPDKMIGPCMNFFKTRFELHSILYKHKTNVAVAFMISDILCLADPYFLISIAPFSQKNAGFNGAAKPEYDSLPLSRAMLHPLSYLRLRDSVIDQIVATTCEELEPARQLVYRLWSRDLYKCAIAKVLKIHKKNSNDRRIWNLPSAEIAKDIIGLGGVHGSDNGGTFGLKEHDVIVHKCDIHHGRKSQDPLSKMRFVEKSQLNSISCDHYKSLPEAKTVPEDEYDSFLPKTLMECSLRIYCRDSAKVDLLRHAFEAWWDNANSEMDLTEAPASPHRKKKRHRVPILSQDSDDDTMVEGSYDEANESLPPWCSPN
jgi:HD superfamily phosphohydrolase